MSRVLRVVFAIALAIVPLSHTVVAAGKSPVNTTRAQLALQGYDAVAYFADGKPVAGSSAFEYRWMNAVWRFASAEHRDRFAKEPEKFAPQFGGYCAYAVSRGYTADGDPKAWRIVDGQLFLNYSPDVQKMWLQDVPGNIAKGRQNWPAALNK